jgi:hypothetical protein
MMQVTFKYNIGDTFKGNLTQELVRIIDIEFHAADFYTSYEIEYIDRKDTCWLSGDSLKRDFDPVNVKNEMTAKYILVEYYEDFGRMGCLTGLFITTRDELDKVIGKSLYWGEVLGKHSEIITESLSISDMKILSEDQEFLNKMLEIFPLALDHDNKVLPWRTINGYNPLEQYHDEHEYDEELEEVLEEECENYPNNIIDLLGCLMEK